MLKKYFSFLRHVNIYFFFTYLFLQTYLFIYVYIPFIKQDVASLWGLSAVSNIILRSPMLNYLTAILGPVLGLENSVKILIIGSFILLPLSFYYFARKFSFGHRESSLIMFLMMIPVVSFNISTGGTLYSAFYLGMIPSAIALPFLFVFLGKLQDAKYRRDSFLLTIILSFLIITHFMTALAAIIALLVKMILWSDKMHIKVLKRVLVFTPLICAFWLIPFISRLKYYDISYVGTFPISFVPFCLFLLAAIGLSLSVLDEDKRVLSSELIILAVLYAAFSFVKLQLFGVDLHFIHFAMYFVLILMVLPYKLVSNHLSGALKIIATMLFIITLLFYFYTINSGKARYEENGNSLFKYKVEELAVKTGKVQANNASLHMIKESDPIELKKASNIPDYIGAVLSLFGIFYLLRFMRVIAFKYIQKKLPIFNKPQI